MGEGSTSDPFAAWRKVIEGQMEAWSKTLAQSMGTEAFAAALGRQMETFLSTQGQLQNRLTEVMEQYLKSLNLPSRGDVARLAAQVRAVEAKADDVDARTEEMLDLLRTVQQTVQALAERLGATAPARRGKRRARPAGKGAAGDSASGV